MKEQKLTRRQFVRMAATLGAGSVLAACAPQIVKETVVVEKPVEKIVVETVVVEKPVEKIVEKIVTPTPAAIEKKTVRWYASWGGAHMALGQQLVAEFNATHPHIDLDYVFQPGGTGTFIEKLTATIVAGNAPDGFSNNAAARYTFEELLLPLNPFIDADPTFDLDAFYPNLTEIFNEQGEQLGIPMHMNTYYFFYNKTLFDEAGLAYPDENYTWDDVYTNGKIFARDADGDGTPDRWGMIIPTYALGQVVYSYGGAWVDEVNGKCLMSRPETIDALQWMADWRNVDHIQPTEADMAGEASYRYELGSFASNKCGQITDNEWSNDTYFVPAMEAGELDFDVAPMPLGPEGRVTEFGGSGSMVFRSTKVPDETWEVVSTFLTGDNFLRNMYILLPECPVAKIALNEYKWLQYDTVPESRAYMLEAPKYAKVPFRYRRFGNEMKDIIWPGLQAMWRGEESAAEAVAKLCPQVEEKLADLIAQRKARLG